MNVAALALDGNKLRFDPNADVNETAAIVLDAKRGGGKSGVLILGGGSPRISCCRPSRRSRKCWASTEKGHDYFLQITDARPDTGGLSRRDAGRGGELGQDRSRPAARRGGLLPGFDRGAAAAHGLRAGAPQAAPPAPVIRRARGDDDAAAHRLRARAPQAAPPGRVMSARDEDAMKKTAAGELARELEHARAGALEAGEILRRHFRNGGYEVGSERAATIP